VGLANASQVCMDKNEIITALTQNHLQFREGLLKLNATDFTSSPSGKWSAGQHFLHIILSVSPVVTAFRLPPFLLQLLFGKANRPSKTFDELLNKYKDKLASGGRAGGRFIPKAVQFEDREKLVNRYNRNINALQSLVAKTPEANLDHYILPHPLLGKLTLREMLYFTILHAKHHHDLTITGLQILKNEI
jgi:hypothetical protein